MLLVILDDAPPLGHQLLSSCVHVHTSHVPLSDHVDGGGGKGGSVIVIV